MPPPLFRDEALAAQAQAHIGEALWDPVATSHWTRHALFAGMGLLALALPFWRAPHIVEAPGYVRPQSGLEVLTAPRAGTVTEVYAASGQLVAARQPVIRISYDATLPKERELAELESRQLEARKALLIAALERERQVLVLQRRSMDRLRSNSLEGQAAARAHSARVRLQEHAVAEEARRDEALLSQGFVSAAAVEARALDRLVALDAPRRAEADAVAQRRSEQLDLDAQLAASVETERRMHQHRTSLIEIDTAIARARMLPGDVVAATQRNRLSQVLKYPGQTVAAGDVIAILGSPAQHMDVEIYLHPAQAVNVKPGQAVIVSMVAGAGGTPDGVPSVPVRGVVSDLASTPSLGRQLDTPVAPSGQVVVANVRLDRPFPSAHAVKARVQIGEWSLADWLVAPLRRRGIVS